MTYDEFKTRFTAMIGNPDTIQAESVSFLEDVEKDYTSLDSISKLHESDEKRIRDLQDTNQKLFLSVTGQPTEEDEKEKEPGIDWDNMRKMMEDDNGK